MVKRSLRKLGEFLIALDSRQAKGPASGSPGDRLRRTRSQSDDRIRRIVERHKKSGSPLVAGAVHLLGMQDIQKTPGAATNAVATEVYGVANQAMKAHLSEEDVYEQYDGEKFIISFASPEKADAERKTNQIAHRIRERLLKEVPLAKDIKVGHHVTQVETATLDPDAPLLDMLVQSLEKVRAAAQTAGQEWRRLLVHDARVAFSPVWHAKGRLVATFRCLFHDETGRAAMARLATLSASDEIASPVCDLDCVLLSRAVEALHGLMRDGHKTKLLIPVNYQTLDHKISREQHGKLCRIIPEAYKESTVFEIHSLPAGASMPRVIDAVQSIKPYGGSVLIDVGMDEKRLAQLSGSWLGGVSTDIGTVGEKSNWLGRFATLGKSLNLTTLVHGVDTMGLMTMAAKAGIDYLDGGAIGLALDAPKPPYRMNLDQSRIGDLETSGSAAAR
jgi:GGDEF domain-containing protein